MALKQVEDEYVQEVATTHDLHREFEASILEAARAALEELRLILARWNSRNLADQQ